MHSYIKSIRNSGLAYRRDISSIIPPSSSAFLKNPNQSHSPYNETALEKAIIEAKGLCDIPASKKECWVAWDIVEELSEAAANLKEKEKFKSTLARSVTVNFNKDTDADDDAYDVDDDVDDDADDDVDDDADDDYNDPAFDIDDSPIFDL
jgi:hypothetical protein